MSLWRNHPAPVSQQTLTLLDKTRRKQVTQLDVLLQALRQARASGQALDLPDIMALSRYWLRFDPKRDVSL
jgi:hypothetical protein